MVRQEKWSDFALLDTVTRERAGRSVLYARFECPYNCKQTVDLPDANIKNNKSNRCHDHLMVCTGISLDGKKAEDDMRVCDERRAKAECSTQIRAAKRGRVDGATTAVDRTVALHEQLQCVVASKEALTTELQSERDCKEKLATTNDGLKYKLQDVEARMQEMQFKMERDRQENDMKMQQIKNELQEFRPFVPLLKRISGALELQANVLPVPPAEPYLEKIQGLKQGAYMASLVQPKSKVNKEMERLCRDNERLCAENERLRRGRDKFRIKHDTFCTSMRNDVLFKSFMVILHPDKRSKLPVEDQAVAEGLFQDMLDARREL